MTREEALDWLYRIKNNTENHILEMPLWWNKPLEEALEMAIKALRMEEVTPVIHAKWIKIDSGDKEFPESIVCSHCHHENSYLHFNEKGEPIQKTFITSNYCPHCGAKMDKE